MVGKQAAATNGRSERFRAMGRDTRVRLYRPLLQRFMCPGGTSSAHFVTADVALGTVALVGSLTT
jgi:hypothetical protein